MASRATSKGIVPVIRVSDSGFEAAFSKMIDRRDEEAEDIDKSVQKIMQRVRAGTVLNVSVAEGADRALRPGHWW